MAKKEWALMECADKNIVEVARRGMSFL